MSEKVKPGEDREVTGYRLALELSHKAEVCMLTWEIPASHLRAVVKLLYEGAHKFQISDDLQAHQQRQVRDFLSCCIQCKRFGIEENDINAFLDYVEGKQKEHATLEAKRLAINRLTKTLVEKTPAPNQ